VFSSDWVIIQQQKQQQLNAAAEEGFSVEFYERFLSVAFKLRYPAFDVYEFL